MSDGIADWHDDIEQYERLCTLIGVKPRYRNNDIDYQHWDELKKKLDPKKS